MPAQPKTSHQLQGQKAVVIGGSSGIGFAVASALVEEGVHVVIASSTQSKIDAAVAKLSDPEQQYNADAKRVEGRTVNLKGPEMEQSLSALFKAVGKFDHLIHTAGDPLAICPLKDVTYDKIHDAGQVRFVSAILASKHAQPYLNKGGSIILTTGSICVSPKPDWVVVTGYAGALVSLGRQLAYDLSKQDLRVNVVSPGAVRTEMWDRMPQDAREKLFEETGKSVLTHTVPGPEKIAQTYLGLLKDTNITAQTIHTDSGALYGPAPQ